MANEPMDRDALEFRRQENEAELNRISGAPGFNPFSPTARWEALEAEQDRIDLDLGRLRWDLETQVVPINFVIKATGTTEKPLWVIAPGVDGIRTLGTRDRADVFHTQEGARVAISKMPQALTDAGILFTIERTD